MDRCGKKIETGRLVKGKIQTIHNWVGIKTDVCSASDPWPETRRKKEEQIWQSWRDKYIPELVALLKIMRMEVAHKSAKKLSEIKEVIDPLLPEDTHKESFSRKALWTVVSTPGVTSVLNGMRHPVYVEDSLTILQWKPLPNTRPIFETLTNTPSK